MLQSRNHPPTTENKAKKPQQLLKTKDFYYKNSPYWSFTVTFSHYWFYSNAGGFPSIFGCTWPAELLGCDHTWSLSMMVEGQWFIGTLTHFTQDDWLICVPNHFWSINVPQKSNHLSFTMGLFLQQTQTNHPPKWMTKQELRVTIFWQYQPLNVFGCICKPSISALTEQDISYSCFLSSCCYVNRSGSSAGNRGGLGGRALRTTLQFWSTSI